MKILRPINALERRIFCDDEFLTAIRTGKPRPFHQEGTIRNHIVKILDYIESHHKSAEEYEDLRILAILHDVGKFAFLEKYLDVYLPRMPAEDRKRFIAASQAFARKYPVPERFRRDMGEYTYTSEHAYVSYLFAKRFLKDKRLLNILKYHDTALDFAALFRKTRRCDEKLFRKIFSKIDLKLYLLFVECDKLDSTNRNLTWLKRQLESQGIAYSK